MRSITARGKRVQVRRVDDRMPGATQDFRVVLVGHDDEDILRLHDADIIAASDGQSAVSLRSAAARALRTQTARERAQDDHRRRPAACLRARAKRLGAIWRPQHRLWEMRWLDAKNLGIADRVPID